MAYVPPGIQIMPGGVCGSAADTNGSEVSKRIQRMLIAKRFQEDVKIARMPDRAHLRGRALSDWKPKNKK
jgi:hypothetical protein